MGYLGKLTKRGVLNAENPVLAGGWTIAFDPASIGIKVESEIYHIAIKGPRGSTFEVYHGTTFYDNVARGDINSWDPSQPMWIQPGTTVFFHYSLSTGTAPTATCYFREVSPV
jgi:hypothetical protein